MAGVTPMAVNRALQELGDNVATWRKLRGLPASILATRAGISKDTLRKIEQGSGGVSTVNFFKVLRALGIMDGVTESTDPYRTDLGKLRAEEVLPRRVRI